MSLRRPGRPPLDDDDPSVNLHVRLPAKQYDAAWQQAQDARLSLSEYVRRLLRDRRPQPFRHQK